jgi:glycosyltransferase involved in cell wall biosynthesis
VIVPRASSQRRAIERPPEDARARRLRVAVASSARHPVAIVAVVVVAPPLLIHRVVASRARSRCAVVARARSLARRLARRVARAAYRIFARPAFASRASRAVARAVCGADATTDVTAGRFERFAVDSRRRAMRSASARVARSATRGARCRRRRARVARSTRAARPTAPSIAFVGWEWIEPSSSAAGARSVALVAEALRRGWRVTCVASAEARAGQEDALRAMGAETRRMKANRGDELRALVEAARPDCVVFDRFLAEEAYAGRLREIAPSVVRVLDMQDAHALRRARERAAKAAKTRGEDAAKEVLKSAPNARDEDLMREIASVQRSDLTLVCSPVEKEWLTRECGVAERKLRLASFFVDSVDAEAMKRDFSARKDFVTIGTFMHKPNVDSVEWLCEEVWPLVRKQLPNATMRVYGSYATENHRRRFHKPAQGFLFEGFAEDLGETLRAHRVLLAPLRFGAGIKGKILDAWRYGLPACTTPIGSEGCVPDVVEFWSPTSSAPIDPEHGWGGFGDFTNPQDIADAAVRLHEDENLWRLARGNGADLLDRLFSARVNLPDVFDAIERVIDDVDAVRDADYFGQCLWREDVRSTTYFSKWIEAKETGATN